MNSTMPEGGASSQGGEPHIDGNGADTPQQKKATAEAVLGTLPGDVRHQVIADIVQGLDSTQQQQAAEAVLGALPVRLRQQVVANAGRRRDTRDTQDTGDRMRYLITVTVAVLLLVAFGLLVLYLNGKADSQSELAWQRRVYLFGGVEAIVFTAVGWIFGREVNRRQVDVAENRAETSEQKADTATSEAATANAKAADLAARGEAAKAAVLARHNVLSNPQNVRTKSVYGDRAGAASTELEDLANFMSTLYPDQ